MLSLKLFAIQVCAIIATLLINSILLYSYFNYIIIDLLPHYMNLQVPLYAIFSTLFGIYIFINNLRIPYTDYSSVDFLSIDDLIRDELTDITYHLMQSSGLVACLIIFMGLMA